MDIEVPHGRTVQQLSAGPAGHLGSWAKVYSSQLGQGTGPAAILGPGRRCTLYSQLGVGTGPAISWAGEQGRAGERAGTSRAG